ncbi:cbb3-type cytochrome c oxidase subunit I [Mucilaginibacter aquariorum]|uniref:Cbb3-type cytochrome c oxidase subunit I n=1 Tax=Mucilaginibacter aquariorum TaxID=2967225 RepID=A0ABT1T179_9SPHI|nr:cbb3-type cytochrome c oxidase subunit I [Mucilaginibacter aquariorum]MCQ6958360.1 cbb3-type cytochrome c oxidase subunit I [Mucilaginibacter aquariorum]
MKRSLFFLASLQMMAYPVLGETKVPGPTAVEAPGSESALIVFLVVVFLITMAGLALWLFGNSNHLEKLADRADENAESWISRHLQDFDEQQLDLLIKRRGTRQGQQGNQGKGATWKKPFLLFLFLSSGLTAFAQSGEASGNVWTNPGVLITVTLILIPILIAIYIVAVKVSHLVRKVRTSQIRKNAQKLARSIDELAGEELTQELTKRRQALRFRLSDTELSGVQAPEDKRGLLHHIAEVDSPRFIAPKKKAVKRPDIDPTLAKLILWYLGTATFWLVLGTSVGEYLGIKFVAPDADHVSWLSFGRLRPVHTNMVFWGWSSLAMIGLGYYVVSTVSNTVVASLKRGWYGLVLINASVLAGSLSLMAGINNGGGEYREYIWPIMLLFAIGLVITLVNYLQTIARRKTKEIYISNWYIVSAVMFTIVIALVGYLPFWQNGLGESIAQGYYMHQGVGMWFMLFNLGLIYYFLPQQLNTPIYSYSLGILAFWTQILFYTLIGTHHFIFSAIPWWLQTVAIIGSMGMLIPVFAGTTNFLMTFRGNFHKIGSSYTLPFYLVGIIFYFTGSFQGTAEAFRSANLYWHFTDFTTAHSHLTMYGIIAFMLWAAIYTLVPRLTGKEPKQAWVGAHFWMALLGLLFYTIPLMIGGTLKGMAWLEGKPFIDSVVLMAPYWLWRAIGGTLMWAAHLIFAYNLYYMIASKTQGDLQKAVFAELEKLPVNPINQ